MLQLCGGYLCREAEARANAAEEAKIELTLALARSDDELRATSARGLQVRGFAAEQAPCLAWEWTSVLCNHDRAPGLKRALPSREVQGVTRGFRAAQKTLHDSSGLPDMPLKTLGFSTKNKSCPLASGAGLIFFSSGYPRVEEADLAAAVQTRRAGKAENEVEVLKAQLAEAQREVKELAWQIKMTFDPNQTSGASSGGQQPGTFYKAAGMLDILGCGANFRRPGK
eukprot:1159246-Pelagomonas_calceolata.AAC.1